VKLVSYIQFLSIFIIIIKYIVLIKILFIYKIGFLYSIFLSIFYFIQYIILVGILSPFVYVYTIDTKYVYKGINIINHKTIK